MSSPNLIPAKETIISPDSYKNLLEKPDDKEVNLSNRVINIWSQAEIDLPRLNKFELNKRVVEDISQNIDATSEQIVDNIYRETNGDERATQQLVKLLQQDWVYRINNQIVGSEIQSGSVLRTVSKVKHTHEIQIKNGKFKIYHEMLVKVTNMPADTKQPGANKFEEAEPKVSYLKAKLVIKGDVADLKKGNMSQFSARILNTEERADLKEATKENYGKVLHFFNDEYESKIK